MAEDRMAMLETLRKAVAGGDVDFLREGVRLLAQAVMEAEVTERCPFRGESGTRSPGESGARASSRGSLVPSALAPGIRSPPCCGADRHCRQSGTIFTRVRDLGLDLESVTVFDAGLAAPRADGRDRPQD
jgi:hypothetical protein